jgi:hypothetical protein
MTDRISADFDTLTAQAPLIASRYLAEAVRHIDEQFGENYAEENPTLAGAFVVACAIECTVPTLAQQIRYGFTEVATEISCNDVSDVAEALRSLAEATASVATAIEYK